MRHRSSVRRSLSLLAAALLLAALTAGPAQAKFYPAQAVDGPSADILELGDLDVSRDGQGAIVYLRREAGVPHVFVSRWAGGRFSPPQRLDVGLDGEARQPAVGAADRGRLAATFSSGGMVYATVYTPATNSWSAPQQIGPGDAPSIDLSVHGAGFLTYSSGGDVRAARLERTAAGFTGIDTPLDVNPANAAGVGEGRSRVAIGADATGIAVWGEDNKVFARRLYRSTASSTTSELSMPVFEGRNGGPAALPDVDIEDDSSFAQVVFRQSFDGDGGIGRTLARRLRGSRVDDPFAIDGLSWGTAPAIEPDIDINARGEGIALTRVAGGPVNAAVLKDDLWAPAVGVGVSGAPAPARGAVSSTSARVISWIQASDRTVHSRFYEDRLNRRTIPAPGPEATVSAPELGPVDPAGGLDVASDRVGDFMTAFVQGEGDQRRIVASSYDRAPVAPSLYSSSGWRNPLRSPLSWSDANDLWGGAQYVVYVDGREIARTGETSLLLQPNMGVGDGVHRWKVAAVDQHGQAAGTATRTLRLDSVAPKATFKVDRSKRRVTVTVKASDVIPPSGRASGVKYVRIDFGSGGGYVQARKASFTYPVGGPKVIRVSATDKAGNASAVTRRIVIPKPKR